MARMTWERKEGIMIGNWTTKQGDKVVKDPLVRYNIKDLFKDWDTFVKVQKNVIEYGIKQKLADSTARPSDSKLSKKEVVKQLDETWALLKSGKWNKKRVAATPLEHAQKEKEELQEVMKKTIEAAMTQGLDKKAAENIAKVAFGPQLTAAQEKINKIKKEEASK